jgi:hypothetical protein
MVEIVHKLTGDQPTIIDPATFSEDDRASALATTLRLAGLAAIAGAWLAWIVLFLTGCALTGLPDDRTGARRRSCAPALNHSIAMWSFRREGGADRLRHPIIFATIGLPTQCPQAQRAQNKKIYGADTRHWRPLRGNLAAIGASSLAGVLIVGMILMPSLGRRKRDNA